MIASQGGTGAWLRCLAPNADAAFRIVCFPFAGGSAQTFRPWSALLPDFEVWAAVLPGHVGRLNEPLATDLVATARAIGVATEALPRPLALYGHSMGAWLALEVARRLEGIGADVGALVVAGRPGPGHDAEPRLAHLPDAQFADQLGRRYGGIPPEVAASSEIMEMFVPILRADIAMMERYDPGAGPRLRCPLLACAGEGDVLVPASSLRSWSIMTNGQFDQQSFPGGHFFIDERREQVVAEIGAWIRSAAGSNVA